MQVDQPISLHKVRDAEYAKAFVEDDDPLYGKMAAVVDEVEEVRIVCCLAPANSRKLWTSGCALSSSSLLLPL